MQSEEWSEWDERHRRQSCEVAASERGQRASFKKISGNARRNSHCRFLVCFPSCRKQQKLKCWADRFCDLAHRWGRTIGKHIALAVERNRASGTSDMHGNAARVAGSEPGGERMNSSRNAAIHCAN